MTKRNKNPNPEQMDIDLHSNSVPSGPVECLGMTFTSDTERRKYFLEKLAEKLKDPEFRKIEGFPIGEDEDILALSDPPYYTACPNPWLTDFVKQYGRPYNPKDKYHREPFAADVSEGKNHPIYNAHSYHTKVPHRAIMRYILHYTEPGDIIFDGVAGTGMTGVAAQLCGNREEVQALGYRIQEDGTILNERGLPFSKLGHRTAILNDLSPIATLLAANLNTPTNVQRFEKEVNAILEQVEEECGWLYETLHKDDKIKGRINYVVWSDVFVCPQCSDEIVFFDAAVDEDGMVSKTFQCTHCGAEVQKRSLPRAFVTYFDKIIGTTIRQAKTVPVLINYKVGRTVYEKKPDKSDIRLMKRIDNAEIPYRFPSDRMIEGRETRRNDPMGLTHVHHFYTKRTLWYLAAIRNRCCTPQHMMWFTSQLINISKLNRYRPSVSFPYNPLSGTLYVASQVSEANVFTAYKNKIKKLVAAFNYIHGRSAISTMSATDTFNLKADYVFVDPPFGSNLDYSELSFLWEVWLGVKTNQSMEAIESKSQKKNLDDYRILMTHIFEEIFRILKPGRWITVEFSNTSATVWNSIQTSLQEVGFVVANVAALDKQQGSFKAVTTPTAVKQDLVISAYKPNGGLEARFVKKAETEEGVWEFIRTHLGNLPVVKPRGGQLEPIVERDPRILFDRTVAFYVRHGIPVPISSPEFQAGLADKFPERDGMYFLSEQAAEYDKVRMKMEGIGQLILFVEDERSAVAWLRNYLKNKPCKYNDIQPEFFEQLNQSWKKWETRPELRALLDQYFLCYSGEGDVPPQIHSYLSTNFKELRNLPSDHAMLRAKARDRWFVPDPRKNADVEQLREKRLLEEFWAYLPPGYEPAARRKKMQTVLPGMEQMAPKIVKGKRIAIVRTEAIRVGFNFCFAQNDYQTIIAVARYIPENVIQNDEQLQMIYDSAMTRTGGGFE
jgi:DNA modification methylase